MEPAARIRTGLPLPPGRSPFHIKGNSYQGALAYHEMRIPGGVSAVLARLAHEPALVAFMRQRFREGALYDVLPMVPFHRAAAEVLDQPLDELLRELSEWQSRRDIHGIYRMLLRLTSPESLMERWAKIASQYFNFVRTEVRRLEPRVYEVSSAGIPVILEPMYRAVVDAYTRTVLESAGARGVRNAWDAPTDDGEREGVALVRTRREVSWAG